MTTDIHEQVRGCAQALADSRGQDTLCINLSGLGGWTDYFILASATSSTHMRGLVRQLEDHVHSRGLQPLRRPSLQDDDEWYLVDFGDFVVHIMSAAAREFYDLESLWHEGAIERFAEAPAQA